MNDWNGWIPIGVDPNGGQTPLIWFRLGEHRFNDAYFSGTIAHCARHPFNFTFCRRTSWDALEQVAAHLPAVRLSGMIFHMSRCGSTLASRVLAVIPGTLVISEAPPVDAVVRLNRRDPSLPIERQIRYLRALLAVFGAAAGPHRHYVLKLDAWNALDVDLFERAFPGVPWVFVYRDGIEVLVSHAHGASYMMSAANAPDFLGLPVADAVRMPREVYCARVLGRITQAVARRPVDAGALVHYEELPHAVWERIAPRFGMTPAPEEVDAMRRRALYNAKRPDLLFQDDRAAKQQAAHAELAAANAGWISAHVAHLESLRER